MGLKHCCLRERKVLETHITNQSLNTQPGISKHSFDVQRAIIEKLSKFEPQNNALPVAMAHILLDECQGLMFSLPRLMEVCNLQESKGYESHYFKPQELFDHFRVIEKSSTGKEFGRGGLSKAFEAELAYFDSSGVLKIEDNWSIILVFKVDRNTHSFSLKKINGQEYILHTLYEVTEDELKAEKELISQTKFNQNKNQPVKQKKRKQENSIKDEYSKCILLDDSKIHNESHLKDESNSLPRYSTRTTISKKDLQGNLLLLRDMTFKGYNCGEIIFSPYSVLLAYLDSVSEDLFSQIEETNYKSQNIPSIGFIQLISFKKVSASTFIDRQSIKSNEDYHNVFIDNNDIRCD